MLNGSKFIDTPNFFVFLASLFTAWAASLALVLLAPMLVKRLGKRGSVALERFVGVMLILISVQMILGGFSAYTSEHPILAPQTQEIVPAQ